MYCPYCGDLLKEKNGTFVCVRGETELSPHVGRGIYDSFILKSVPHKKPAPSTFRWGGHWYCPACGMEMEQLPGTNGMICSHCSGNLGPFIYELIELNWHKLDQNV
jgi:DNA-directed RNA polymerase subunit RPC12/RpoP